ncbi:MAG: hypothetical protein R6U50_06605 [Desulfobacterales bacterium]
MIVFDGKYSWSGVKKSEVRPVNWWSGAYWLKIIDLSGKKGGVLMLKPIVAIISDTGEGASAANYASELVKSVCRDFNLDIKKLNWIEFDPGPPEQMNVAKLIPVARLKGDVHYTADWRSIRIDELEMIAPYSLRARRILRSLSA